MGQLIDDETLKTALISCRDLGRRSCEAVVKVIESQPTIEAVERNDVIDEFYDEVLNFEDYIEPVEEDNGILLYSGCDITDMVVKIRKKLKGEEHE